MGLRDAIQKAVAAGFKGLGDIPETVSFDHIVTSEYDTSAGVASTIEERYIVSGVFSNFKFMETPYPPTSIDVRTDLQFIAPRKDWVFQPSTRDALHRLESGATVTYEVRDIRSDPVEATYVLTVRRRG